MKNIRYGIDRDIPVTDGYDVIVTGAGPGGIGAAVMAARFGAKTLLVERYGFPGGMAVSGEVHPFMPNHVDGKPLDRPVYTDWIEKMQTIWPREDKERHISKDAAMIAAEELCIEAGVELLYHHVTFDVIMDGRRIDALVLHSKSGLTAVRGKMYVDCTGDADVAALSGCEFEEGGPTGHCQPMTLCFKLSGVDRNQMPDREGVRQLYDEARERGEIECPRQDVLFFDWLEDDVVHFNTTRIIHRKGTDGRELSDAETEGRKQLRQFLTFFRKHVPGFKNAQLHSVGHHIGIRETRRVRGLEYLTREAFENRQKFPDAVARVRYSIDIHNPDGSGTELVHMPEGEWYEIPYGCVVAKDADNLLVGGRPISVDHAIHSSMRVMPSACSVGQAAGLAAAMSAQKSCMPKDLDGKNVRQALAERGAYL